MGKANVCTRSASEEMLNAKLLFIENACELFVLKMIRL